MNLFKWIQCIVWNHLFGDSIRAVRERRKGETITTFAWTCRHCGITRTNQWNGDASYDFVGPGQ